MKTPITIVGIALLCLVLSPSAGAVPVPGVGTDPCKLMHDCPTVACNDPVSGPYICGKVLGVFGSSCSPTLHKLGCKLDV